jgi:glycosyltransferase involved in cell wall biosynthesis
MDYLAFLSYLHARLHPAVYLEVGFEVGRSLAVSQTRSVAIDPNPHPELRAEAFLGKPWVKLFQEESDKFFATHTPDSILDGHSLDLAFIDGLHQFGQVARDLENIEHWGHPGTVVVIHDVLPNNSWMATRAHHDSNWTGDVWRIVPFLQDHRPDLQLCLLNVSPTGVLVVTNLNRAYSGMAEIAASLDGSFPSDGPEYERRVNSWIANARPESPIEFLRKLRETESIPRVTVVMSSYNHASFVGHAIESVLSQSFNDLEFLISDDGSTDGTASVIKQFSDPRITFAPHASNRGAYAVINELIGLSHGEYIAHLNSDDFWLMDKLAFQVDFLDNHPEYAAIFGNATYVDENDSPLEKSPFDFAEPNRSSGAWLRRFFDNGPCLCHPTVLVRRSCYTELGGYKNWLRQTPDFDMWVRFVKRFALFVSDRTLVHFRWIPGRNVSTPSPENAARYLDEYFLVARQFFDCVSREFLLEGFADLLIKPSLPSDIHVDIEKAMLFFRPTNNPDPGYRVVGLEMLDTLLASASHREVLMQDYGFDELAFHRLLPEVDTFYRASYSDVPVSDTSHLLPKRGP